MELGIVPINGDSQASFEVAIPNVITDVYYYFMITIGSSVSLVLFTGFFSTLLIRESLDYAPLTCQTRVDLQFLGGLRTVLFRLAYGA